LVFENAAKLPQAKTTPQINPVQPTSNPGHGERLRKLCRSYRKYTFLFSEVATAIFN
jgi:hypothetical protein